MRQSKARVHFIDDRLETLRAVSEVADLRHVQLYLAAWCAPPELCSSRMRLNLAEEARFASVLGLFVHPHRQGVWSSPSWLASAESWSMGCS